MAGFRPSLERAVDVLRLVLLGALISTAVSATIGTSSLLAGGEIDGEEFGSVWRTWWLGDMGGALVVAPALMVAFTHWPFRVAAGRVAEAVGLTALVTGTVLLAFTSELPITFALVPLPVVAAFRFGQPGAVLASLITAAIAIPLTQDGQGPFADYSPDDRLLMAQLFVGVVSITTLIVAAVVTERRRAEESVRKVAETLQESLLPAGLPAIAGIQAAVEFRPAGDREIVGGDFYELVEGDDGSIGVAIGDALGKGAIAAADTALARYTLRAAALQESRPSRILGVLNEAILGHASDHPCTVAYARLERHDGGASLTVSLGGHPKPLILRGDGTVEPIGMPAAAARRSARPRSHRSPGGAGAGRCVDPLHGRADRRLRSGAARHSGRHRRRPPAARRRQRNGDHRGREPDGTPASERQAAPRRHPGAGAPARELTRSPFRSTSGPMNFIEDVLERFPASKPALVALSREGERRVWHFGELIAMSAGVSGALAARGVGRGDVVMTLVGNRIEWVLTLLACWRMGAVALPCNTQLRRHDLELRVAAANPSLCVGEEPLLAELPDGVPAVTLAEFEEILDEDRPQETPASIADLGPEDPALIVFTSGTTGEPRGALHATRYLAGQRAQAEHWLGARRDELVWCTTATGWSKSARNVFVAPWLCGAAALICDERFDAVERLDVIEREGVNVLCQAPTEYRMLAKRAALRPLPAVRRLVSAGEALNAEVIEAFRSEVGLSIHDGYGQTETGHLTGSLVDDEVRPGSMGRALPGFELRLEGDEEAGAELQLRAVQLPDVLHPIPRPGTGRRPRHARRRRVVAHRRHRPPRSRWPPHLRRAQRRPDPLVGLPDRPVRGGVGAAHAPGGRGGGGGGRARPGARRRRPRGRRPARGRAHGAARRRAARARQGRSPRPTRRRASSSSRTSCRRPRAARSAARDRCGR